MRVALGFSSGATMRLSNPDSWRGTDCLVAIAASDHRGVILDLADWPLPAVEIACGDARNSLTIDHR
jgi:hypothetical protein